MTEREALNAAIEAIAARFRSGNRIPVDKATVPASEWDALVAALAQPVAAPEPVAIVESWTNSSYSRNYKLRWLRDVPEWTALYAEPPVAQPVAAKLAGWVLVPREPTPEMLSAHGYSSATRDWVSMINARPTSPTGE